MSALNCSKSSFSIYFVFTFLPYDREILSEQPELFRLLVTVPLDRRLPCHLREYSRNRRVLRRHRYTCVLRPPHGSIIVRDLPARQGASTLL